MEPRETASDLPPQPVKDGGRSFMLGACLVCLVSFLLLAFTRGFANPFTKI